MASSSTGKGKSTDRSTDWSHPKWDKSRQQWYSSRRDVWGEKEYHWYPSETANTALADPSIPRTIAETDTENAQNSPPQSYSSSPAVYTATPSAHSQVATTTYNISATSPYATTSSYTTSADPAFTSSDPYEPSGASSYSNSAEASHALAPSSSPQSAVGTNVGAGLPLSPRNSYGSSGYGSNYPSDYISAGYANADTTAAGLTSEMGALELIPQATFHGEGQAELGEEPLPVNTKRIYKAPGTGVYEELDPRYKTIADKDRRRFWTVGRVFMMLWTEPAQVQQVGPDGGTRNGSHFSTTWLNGEAYSEIRRFVVVRAGYGNCICSPIQTYSGQATLKPNLPEREQHAMIYTSDYPPAEYFYVATNGTVVRENLSKDSIRVIREQSDKEGHLGELSRLNYSKIYTVEHYVRVLNIGIVATNSLQSLEANCYVRPPSAPPGRPKSYPPPANQVKREPRDSKNKHKSKGSRKTTEHGGQRRH